MVKGIAITALVLVLVLVNISIYHKEKHLAEGRIVYLQLAPIDPRSLMQGDYMALRFQVGRDILNTLPKKQSGHRWRQIVDASDGYVVVNLDDKQVGTFNAIYESQPLSDQQVLMRYRIRNDTVKFATNAFFFQEGDAKLYEKARFGQFRVDDDGELLLTAMYDKDLGQLGPEAE